MCKARDGFFRSLYRRAVDMALVMFVVALLMLLLFAVTFPLLAAKWAAAELQAGASDNKGEGAVDGWPKAKTGTALGCSLLSSSASLLSLSVLL